MMSSATEDLDLIRRDAALPGLGLILDSGQLLERCAHHPLLASVSDLSLDYVRYKPGMNCLGRYRFVLNGAPAWAYAKVFSSESNRKLEKARKVFGAADVGDTSLVLPEWSLFLSFFPRDLKLRSICRLADDSLRDRLFRRVFDEREQWVGSNFAVLNYKPERRLVVRLTAREGRSATVKFHTRREFERLARVRETAGRAEGVLTPNMIGLSRKHCCHAFNWIEGETLRARQSSAEDLVADFRQAGRLIARFHATRSHRGSGQATPTQAPTLQSLAQQLAFLVPGLEPDAYRIAAELQQVEQRTPRSPGLIHGDFYDKQIIVSDGQFGLIDLDCARPGDVHQDLACFLVHRERQVLNGTADFDGTESRTHSAFLDGYLEEGGGFSERRLAQWMAWHLFRLSHHPFRDRAPGWPDQVRAMLGRARQLLEQDAPPVQAATA